MICNFDSCNGLYLALSCVNPLSAVLSLVIVFSTPPSYWAYHKMRSGYTSPMFRRVDGRGRAGGGGEGVDRLVDWLSLNWVVSCLYSKTAW